MKKAQLSCLIRTKDEEKNIIRAIKSVSKIADEIVVLDSGSRDKTVELAKEHGAKVYFKEWSGYAAQLNYGLELCTKDWILILDADEEVSEELQESIAQ